MKAGAGKIGNFAERLGNKVTRTLMLHKQQRLEWEVGRQIAAQAINDESQSPVIFFNASSRLVGMSYNSAFHQLTAWALRLKGVPVIHFICNAGMSRCVLGTNRDKPSQKPPCQGCLAQSRALSEGSDVTWFQYEPDPELVKRLESLSLHDLMFFTFHDLPLGKIILPSVRWVLRRYHLFDDAQTRFLFCQFILSGWNIARKFSRLIEEHHPQSLVVFNGVFFPEAIVSWIARRSGLQVVSHEIGFLPSSGFFSFGNATAYPLDPPENFRLGPDQEKRLDAYLENRFKGNFSMAGIRFWPEIKSLDASLLEKMETFKQVIPIFTNVIFDTSQEYANGIFNDMFDWLSQIKDFVRSHPDSLFIFRAHPDETRKGKASRETVANWLWENGLDTLPNVVFISPEDYVSSYELVQRSKLILVYNSSVGLEASILGKVVVCAGKVRYHTSGCQTVLLPESIPAYFQVLEDLLAGKKVEIPDFLAENGRRFLYYQIFLASLPFHRYLQAEGNPGFVGFTTFSWKELLPENSDSIQVLLDGILNGKPFLMPESQVD
jgi:hypothetical protein